jgi:signal transduction histidine kinase
MEGSQIRESMNPDRAQSPAPPASRSGQGRLDLARARAELAEQFTLALLLMLPPLIGLRFLAFRQAGHWPPRFFNLLAIFVLLALFHLNRRRLDYRPRTHVALILTCAFWVQQTFQVGPMEPGTLALPILLPLTAGLLLNARAGWAYAAALTGILLLGAALDRLGCIPQFPHTQGWARLRLWDFWLSAAVGIPVMGGSLLVAIRRQLQAWEAVVLDLEREMADRARLQEQLLQARKLESVGRLAGGVAHDVNNLLSAVLGHVELIEGTLAPDDPIRANLQGIRQAGLRSGGIVRQLQFFARQQPSQPAVLDLNAHIGATRNMIAPLVGAGIQVRFNAGEGLWQVAMDPAHLDQILVNLAVNARDAMPGGGILTLETANVHLGENDGRDHPGAAPGPHVRITVGDQGTGMDAQTLTRIFEPFYTTKAPGRGTGLGLATVLGIVKQAGGFIEVRTAPGAGTAFRIYLPACAGPAGPGTQPAELRNPSVASG